MNYIFMSRENYIFYNYEKYNQDLPNDNLGWCILCNMHAILSFFQTTAILFSPFTLSLSLSLSLSPFLLYDTNEMIPRIVAANKILSVHEVQPTILTLIPIHYLFISIKMFLFFIIFTFLIELRNHLIDSLNTTKIIPSY